MYPYKIQTLFRLHPNDIEEPNFWQHFIIIDEANVCLSGRVNQQNDRFWEIENRKVVVWCAICFNRIIGPFFLEDAKGNAVTVNGERYRTIIREFLQPQLEELGLQNFWFQQDCATYHTARETVAHLRDVFPAKLISKMEILSGRLIPLIRELIFFP